MLRSIVALLIVSSALFAQEQGTITGVVTDPSGAAIPNATIKTTNIANNQSSETKSATDGNFTIPYLAPGVYNVEATAPGFQSVKRQNIVLAVSQRLNLPLQMPVGQATTEITVTGQQEVIQSTDADRGLVFDPIKTQEYPLNGRQSYMLLSLTPGVIFTQEQFGASGFSGTRGWDVNSSYKFNGARAGNGNNVFMLNGGIISDNGSQWDFAPSVDAIQEFTAITTAYDASYGHEAGGVVNTVIRGGTNNWHGDVYDYFRNRVLDANNFANNAAGAPKGRHNQNQFGGVFGGPIRKDKDFLFMSYEGWQEIVPFPGSGVTAVPLDIRDGQHFAQYGMTEYDPLTTHPCGAPTEPCSGSTGSTYWRNPFPGDVIPASRISPIAQKILSYLPAPNTVGQFSVGAPAGSIPITNNYINPTNEGRYWYNQPIVRWDHVLSDKDRFYMLFSEFHGFEYRSTSTFPPPVATGNSDNNRTFTGINLDETHVISPTAVLDIRANWFRFVQLTPSYTSQALAISAASLGMTGLKPAPTVTTSVMPEINIGGYTGTLFGSGGSYSWSPYNSWQFTPNLTLTRGKHSLRFGFEVHYEAKGNVAPGDAYGQFTFGNITSQASGHTFLSTENFNGIASLLLGIPTSGDQAINASYYITRPYYAWYAQDDWKVNNRLTVNIGLRYDVQLPYLERYNRMASMFNINQVSPLSNQIESVWAANAAAYNATNPKYPYPAAPPALYGVWEFAGQNGYPRRAQYTDWTNGAPRIGFAFRANDKTVIRGGFGVFYQSITSNANSQTGFSQTTNYQATFDTVNNIPSACSNPFGNTFCNNGAPTGPYSLVNPFPQGLIQPQGTSQGALANIGQGSTSINLHYKIPRTYQYSLGIQRQLPKNVLLDISFAGNYNLYTDSTRDLGHIADAAGLANQQLAINDGTFFSRQVANPFYGILPSTVSLGANQTVAASTLLNNYPLWGGYTDSDIANEVFRSDALQVLVSKRAFGDANSAAGILTFNYSMTFSKEYSTTCCWGNSWQYTTGAYPQLVPQAGGTLTANLVTFPLQNYNQNMIYAVDSNNKSWEHAFSGVWDLPFGKGKKFGNSVSGVGDKLLTGWRWDYIFTYISGFPVGSIGAVNYCGTYNASPTTGQPQGRNQYHWFNNNPSCYTSFPANTINTGYLTAPRFTNDNNPAAPQLNFAVEKNTTFKERYKLQFRAESFNLTNTPIRPGPGSTTYTSPSFGVIPANQQNFPRLVQLAMKLYF
jgi:hypothetical protein